MVPTSCQRLCIAHIVSWYGSRPEGSPAQDASGHGALKLQPLQVLEELVKRPEGTGVVNVQGFDMAYYTQQDTPVHKSPHIR
jgi:hypothetical protein